MHMDGKKEEQQKQRTILWMRMELWFAPFIIILPCVVSIVFLVEWYTQGFLAGNILYTTQGLLGVCILTGNLLFAIPFIKTLHHRNKGKKKIH